MKNIAGHIKFNATPPQIIRTLDDRTSQAMDCPFVQLDRNLDGFNKISPFTDMPIYTFLVWANSSATIDLSFTPSHPLIPLKKLPLTIQELEKLPDTISSDKLTGLKEYLITRAKNFQNQSYCERFNIHVNELTTGLYCNYCNMILSKQVRTWVCLKCKVKAKDALAFNISSQFVIQRSKLTIIEIRRQIPQLPAKQIRKILNEEGYLSEGTTKSKRYSRRN